MFTIQYIAVNGENKMQDLDSKSRSVLLTHLAKFQHPIEAVYEGSTPITKFMRIMLRNTAYPLSLHAREFMTRL